ncbi:hypothetical protein HPB51_024882 [Rhipicephalus microplus]|uniref:Uncharacterized protein n=1 Tax=Rhipicephalus microplus TaxID=6941 RepID=A0A9J6EQ92_RHIMP|nr:hypothetical protein HPB51_024882 [Rhipicephalus microplus]
MPCGGCKVSGFDASVSFDVRMRVLRSHACEEWWSVRWPGILSAIPLSFVRTSTRRGSQRHLIAHAERGAFIVREKVPRRNAMAGGMTEAEEAASLLAYGLIITITNVVACVIVMLIFCLVCCIRGYFRAERLPEKLALEFPPVYIRNLYALDNVKENEHLETWEAKLALEDLDQQRRLVARAMEAAKARGFLE